MDVEDDDDTSLDSEFIDHIMHMKIHYQLSTPSKSFMYISPVPKEPKQAQDPQCCAHVWDEINNTQRRCRCRIHPSQENAFRGCEKHQEVYKSIVAKKIDACKYAQESYTKFDLYSTTKDEAQKILRAVFNCLEYRITVMYSFFHPNTNCERKKKGHFGALDWFEYDKMFEIHSIATQKSDAKILTSTESSAQQISQEVSKNPIVIESSSEKDENKEDENEEDEEMLLWNAVISYMQDNTSMKHIFDEKIQTFVPIPEIESSLEYDERFQLKFLFENEDESLVDASQDKILAHSVKDDSHPDPSFNPEDHLYKDKSFYVYILTLTRELQEATNSNFMAVALRRTYKRLDDQLAFTHNLFFCLFRQNGIIGLGYWLFQKESSYKFIADPKLQNCLKLFGFSTQFICHAFGNLCSSKESFGENTKVVIINLKRKEFNGKIATIIQKLETGEDGQLYFKIQCEGKFIKIKMKNIVPKPVYYMALTTSMISPRYGRGNILLCKANESEIKCLSQILYTECFSTFPEGANLKIHEQVIHEIITGDYVDIQVKKIGPLHEKNKNITPSTQTANIKMTYPISMMLDITLAEHKTLYKNEFTNLDDGKVKHENMGKANRIKKTINPKHLTAENIRKEFSKLR